MTRRLSLLTPSGRLTLGNYLGALRPMAATAGPDTFYGLSDLHALTTPHDPALLRTRTAEMATLMLAAGLDESTLFLQSQVPQHRDLTYLLECVAHTGELNRMIQFREKSRASRQRARELSASAREVEQAPLRRGEASRSDGRVETLKGVDSTRASLYTYPVLMAADILLYRAPEIPVGEDQRQHVELARDLAIRFNSTYGLVFTVPKAVHPPIGARVMDLADPTRKMSKSAGDAHPGSIFLLDTPEVVRRKVARAVTDSDTSADMVRRDREAKPGITNLLDILEACGGSADGITSYGGLKAAVTDAVVSVLEPIQKRYAELVADRSYVTSVYAAGAARCREVTAPVLAAAEAAIGLA